MSDLRDPRLERARERRKIAVLAKGRIRTGEQDLHPVRGEEAISLLTRLTEEIWSISGLPRPTYSRTQIPCRFLPGAKG